MVIILDRKNKIKRISVGVFLILIFFTISFYFIKNYCTLNQNKVEEKYDNDYIITPKVSSTIGFINLTNYWINDTIYSHNSSITIEGKIFKPLPPPPPYVNLPNVNVALVVDGFLDTRYNATSNGIGEFQINYRIPFTIDVYSSHKIEVECIDDLGTDVIKPINFFIISINTTSIFDITYIDNYPKIPGEDFRVEGFLRYDNMDGIGIPGVQINYHWFNNTYNWPISFFFTDSIDGSFTQDIAIPSNVFNQAISLNLSYSGDFPRIGNSEIIIPNIILFSDVVCIWNIVDKASEEDPITIAGQLVSISNSSVKIGNRTLIISFNGEQIDSVPTDSDGYFSYPYTIPSGIGIKSIEIEVVNTAGLILSLITYINITAAPYTPSNAGGLPPFFMFSVIFFPILGGITAILAVLGYRYYKKQEQESRVVSLPLESKLINLKLLKDSGRLEESISYLFNAIYINLVDAKYGRTRRDNETIRDFAIISVKELKLTPAAIYPFIQKVEEIIYAKPFKITENDFYKTCELFSPVYFQLTGYNFQLNF
ncbi:MAG: hypothetical protein ACFFG0_18730 [Candidatus Thorarchaeota archaeon]